MDPYSLPWIITDDALADLDQHLAAHAPERGAALLGPPGTRLITDIIVDPVDGGRAEYWHSDQLRIALEARRAVDANVTYMGTCHSHPSGMAAPSEPDRRAFRSTLDANPHLRDLLFPIVVDRRVEDLAPVYRGNHLTALSHGTLAGFTAVGHGRRTVIAPVELTVVPVGAQARAIARALDWRVAAIHPAEGPGGLPWLQVTWTSSDGGPAAQMLLPPAYPMAAPLLRPANAPVFLAPAWDPAGDPVAQALATLTTNAPTPPAGPAAPSPALAAPTGFLDRLTHHLPHRGDWHVTVAGAGSVGSVVAEALARSGVPRLTLVDPDPVEAANLSRTVYTTADLGKAKVAALAARLTAINPCLLAEAREEDLLTWLADDTALATDLVILATDDIPAELMANAVLFPHAIPLISVKMFARGDAGEILIAHPQGACLRCLTGSRGAPIGRDIDYGSGRLVAELALGPDIAVTAQRAAKIALALLSRNHAGGPLADWIDPILEQDRCMLLTANVAEWGIFAHLDTYLLDLDGPFQSLWVRTGGMADPDCPVCGRGPEGETQHDGRQDLNYLLPLPIEAL